MAENTQPQQRLRKVDIIGPDGTVIAQSVLISPKAEDVKVENEIVQKTEGGTETKTPVSANLKDFLFKKFSSTTESDGGDTIEIRAAGDDYFSIDPSKISILQSWSDYQNLNKKRLVGLYDKDENNNIVYIADFLSGIENLDPTLAQFETTDTEANIDAVIGLYDLKEYTPVTIKDEEIGEGTPVSAEDQAKELMASLGDSSFWQRLIERERADKDRLIGIYDEEGVLKGHFEPTKENLDAIVNLYNKGILCYENNITAADGTQSNQKVYKGTVTSLEDAYDLVIDLKKKSIYQHLIELKDFWIVLPFECYDNVEEAGHSIANKYDIDGLSWAAIPTESSGFDFSLSVDGNLAVVANRESQLSVIIPSAINGRPVTSIAPEVFKNDSWLASVTLPDSVTSIGWNAFYECPSITSVYITDIAKWCGISFGNQFANPLYYAENLYLNGNLVTNLEIPDSVKNISDYAFFSCNDLTSVTIPSSVTSIGKYAFRSCNDLTSVTIPDSVTSIGNYAFNNCDSLTSITIGNSVEKIGDLAFWKIGNKATITLLGTKPPTISKETFQSSYLEKIIVPKDCKAKYIAETNWAALAEKIQEAAE